MSKTIKILGTGCRKCHTMTAIVKEAIAANQTDATIEKIEDIEKIMEYNVMSTPALVIDDVIAIKGRVPTKEEVMALLQ